MFHRVLLWFCLWRLAKLGALAVLEAAALLAGLWTPDHSLVALCCWKMFRLWGWPVLLLAALCFAALRARGEL